MLKLISVEPLFLTTYKRLEKYEEFYNMFSTGVSVSVLKSYLKSGACKWVDNVEEHGVTPNHSMKQAVPPRGKAHYKTIPAKRTMEE